MSDDDDEPPPPLFSQLYWAVMAAGLALTLAGAAVGLLGPRLLQASAGGRHVPPALTGPGAHGRGAGRPTALP
jgi:hypothetical protein